MKKHTWETAWEDKKFVIETSVPSILVSRYEGLLKAGDRILDIGCGNGRNSIYLAHKAFETDCFDVADLGWQKELPHKIREKINFKKSSVLEYPYEASRYRAIVVARVIQYLNKEELSFLWEKIAHSIRSDGFLLLSYNTQGGIFEKKDIAVSKYSYPIDQIETSLRTIFKTVIVSEGSKRNRHVNYEDDILSFDIFASDPHQRFMRP